MPLSPSVLAGFGCALATLLAIGTAAVTSLDSVSAISVSVARAHNALERLGTLHAAMRGAQAAHRGYVLTGREVYLIAFSDAQADVLDTVGSVRSRSDDPHAPRERTDLASTAMALLALLQRGIDLQQKEGIAAAQAFVNGDEGQALQVRFETLRRAYELTQRDSIRALETEASLVTVRTRRIVIAGMVLACLLLIVATAVVYRDAGRRARANRTVSRLAEFGQLLQACESAEEAYGVVESAAPELFGQSGSLYRLRASANLFERASDWGLNGPVMFQRDGCWALRRGTPHESGPGLSAPRCEHLVGVDGLTRCMPLTSHGDTLGILVLRLPDSTSDEARVAHAAAEQVAGALGGIALRETLRAQSIRDELTGLFNRRFFEESLERETRRALRLGRPLSVIIFDVDHFKRFNDTWGHEAGDAVLREIGSLVRALFRTEDVGCRYGGEEFVLILTETDLEHACSRADQLRGAVANLVVRLRGQTLDPVSISCGVACSSAEGTTGASLLAAADHALYVAKRNGRNRVEGGVAQAAA